MKLETKGPSKKSRMTLRTVEFYAEIDKTIPEWSIRVFAYLRSMERMALKTLADESMKGHFCIGRSHAQSLIGLSRSAQKLCPFMDFPNGTATKRRIGFALKRLESDSQPLNKKSSP